MSSGGQANTGFTRDSTIRRDSSGQWFHDGQPVTNAAVARAFDRWIDVAEDGRFILKNTVNWVYVQIEGAPLFVRALASEGAVVKLALSDGTEEKLDPTTLRQDEEGALYTDVRKGKMVAQFTRSAQHLLAPWVGEDAQGTYLEVNGRRTYPPTTKTPLAR